MNENENKSNELNSTSKELKELDSTNSLSLHIPKIKIPSELKINNEIDNRFKYNQNLNDFKIKNINFSKIEPMIKLKKPEEQNKFNYNIDTNIKYLKLMNSQKYSPTNNYSNTSNNSSFKKYNYLNENSMIKTHQTGESTFDNSDQRNYIGIDFENSNSKLIRQKNEKLYQNLIKKNISNNIYYKRRNKNMCFRLKKNNKLTEKTIKNSLETIHSKEDIYLNYKKFSNVFLIINDILSISNNTVIKNTNNSFFKFLNFLNNNEILILFSINREIRNCIIGCLAYKVKEKILPDFTQKYCKDFIFNNEYNFMILSKLYKKEKSHIRFILSIKPKITKINSKIINKRIKIGFSEYICNKYTHNILNKEDEKIKVNTCYLFEIIEKLYPKNYWVFKENTTYHYDENGKAYYNDIMQFWPGDKALINVNLISEIGIINFDNFIWTEPKMVEIKNINKKNTNLSIINNCEVEEIIHEWNKLCLLENCEIVKKNLDELFSQNFIIKEIHYDDVGYLFFKILLKAYKVGTCNGKDGNLGIKINILPINYHITNEIKKNGLIFDENNELAVNVGDIITFYISQNKNG
jgi:hypothetical protein